MSSPSWEKSETRTKDDGRSGPGAEFSHSPKPAQDLKVTWLNTLRCAHAFETREKFRRAGCCRESTSTKSISLSNSPLWKDGAVVGIIRRVRG